MSDTPGRGLTSAVKIVVHLPQPVDAMLQLLRIVDALGATIDVTDPDGWTLTVPARADDD
jgi:hypothetical protein